MTDTRGDEATRARGLTPGHWITIATITVAVLGGVLSWGLSEHNARLANVESGTTNIAEGLAQVEGSIKTINERLNRIETNIDTLIQLHLQAGTSQPAASRQIESNSARQDEARAREPVTNPPPRRMSHSIRENARKHGR